MTQIIIWRDKHSDYYFDASTEELWANASVYLLREQLKRGYIWEPEEPTKPVGLLSREEIGKLPEPYKVDAIKKVESYQRQFALYQQNKADYDVAVRVAKEGDTSIVESRINEKTGKPYWRKPGAWRILERYRDGQYQHVELEDLTVVEKIEGEEVNA